MKTISVLMVRYDEPKVKGGRDFVCYLGAEAANQEVRQLSAWGLNPGIRKVNWKPEYGTPNDAPPDFNSEK